MTKVAIVGALGRMGRMLIQSTFDRANTELVACFVKDSSPLIGQKITTVIGIDSPHCDVCFSALSQHCGTGIDVLIDFSLPTACKQTIDFCQTHHIALVMGVTGLDAQQEQALATLATTVPVVYAGNYSLGVNLSLNLLATTAKALGLSADVEIIEAHHRHKLDAPSGTALMMAKAVAGARDQDLAQVAVYGRNGHSPRQSGDIGIHAVRGGEIVGEHCVRFILNGEIIEITHKAQNRATFAHGAVAASAWIKGKPAKLYDMQDVLGLK